MAEEHKQEGESLEDITKNTHKEMEKNGLLGKVAKGAFYTALSVGSAALSYGLVGINGPLTGIAFGLGNVILKMFKKKENEDDKGFSGILKDFTVGNLAGIVGAGIYDYAAACIANPWYRALAGATAGNVLFATAYLGTEGIIKKGAGAAEHFSKNYWSLMKNTMLIFSIPVALTINGYLGGYPGIVAVDTAYKVMAGLTAKDQSRKAYAPKPAPAPSHIGSPALRPA